MNVSAATSTPITVNPQTQQNPIVADAQSSANTTRVHAHEHSHHGEGHRKEHDDYHPDHRRALGVLGNELRQRLSAMFRVVISTQTQGYNASNSGQTPDNVAAATVGAAQKAIVQDPASAGQIVGAIRGQVDEAASVANQTANDPSATDIAQTTSRINQGLDALVANSSQNTAASATVLSVDSASRQQSTIRIRTQEGDTVSITLKQSSQLSATGITASDASGDASATQIARSNGSSLSLKFDGNINDQELAAIQDVFEQAAVIADDFFGGDLAAAVNDAQGFQFDSSQLARVSLGFRSEQFTRASFATASTAASSPASATENSNTQPTAGGSTPAVTPPDSAAAAPTSGDSVPVSEAAAPTPLNSTTPEAAPQAVQADTSGLSQLFDRIAGFLRSVSEGFSGSDEGNTSVRYHYTQSFKLDLLKSAVQVAAPDAADQQLADINAAIDQFPATTDPTKSQTAQAA